MTNAATQAVERIYRPGYRYSKAEVLLLDLRQPGEYTDDLFAQTQPKKCEQLMRPGHYQRPLGPGYAALSHGADSAGLGHAPRPDESELDDAY